MKQKITKSLKQLGLFVMMFGAMAFSANAQYTLTDADVTMTGGEITTCTYDGAETDIVIPETLGGASVTNIAGSAFVIAGRANKFSGLTLPSTLVSIGQFAFDDQFNDAATTIIIPANVETISNNAFARDKGVTLVFEAGSKCTVIGTYAFGGSRVPSVNLPEGLESIGAQAFMYHSLATIDIPSTVTFIGANAFAGGNGGATGFTLPGTDSDTWNGGTIEGGTPVTDFALEYTKDVAATSYTVAFVDYDGTTVLKEETVDEGAAATAPADPTRDGYTFAGWDVAFDNITADLTVTAQYSINTYTIAYELDGGTNDSANPADYTVETETITLAAATKDGFEFDGWYWDAEFLYPAPTIDQGTASDITLYAKWGTVHTLTADEVTIVDGRITACSYDFNVKNIIIPAQIGGVDVKEIGIAAGNAPVGFANQGITSVQFSEGLEKIGNASFLGNELTTLVIPSTVTTIYGYAFVNNSLTDVTIPANVTLIDKGAFAENIITTLNGAPLTDGFIYNRLSDGSDDMTSINSYAGAATEVTIPAGVTMIGHSSFQNTTHLTAVTIPEGVTNLNHLCFNNCSLDTVILPNSLVQVGIGAFKQNNFGTFALPETPGYTTLWSDAKGNDEIAGGSVMNASLHIGYTLVSSTINTYTITYNLDGGTNDAANPADYTIETATITLAAATKAENGFGGWYDNAEFTGDVVTEIVLGSTGDLTLYAKFGATGVSELAQESIKVYPNPANDVINIAGAEGQALIINATGSVVLSSDASAPINVSALTPGIYFVKVGSSVEKVVIK